MHSIFVIVSTITQDAAALATYEINGIATEGAAHEIAQAIASRSSTHVQIATVCYVKKSN
jgi:hypothetical protein